MGSRPASASPSASEVRGPAHEWNTVVHALGDAYGLYPSEGVVWVFGSGNLIHHDETCGMGNQTPPHRRLRIPDPSGNLFQDLLRSRAAYELRNVDDGPVLGACAFCTLIPLPGFPPADIVIEDAQPFPN